jgi:DNA-binding SARP family transcriptional activator
MTQLRLLGPLEFDGVALPGGKPRALLARLGLDAGRVVATDVLVEALWGELPPPSAHKVLQAHVSALRKALGSDAIETRSPGYVLRAARTDLASFESLADSARAEPDPGRRAQLYHDALSLWRGPALVEFRREPFALAAGRRLAELRLEALGQRIEAELELGEHERLVGELQGLVEQEPLREQPRRQLMLALYRYGRQAEALACYRDGRRLLVDQLGIEPSPALQELERAILRQDSGLTSASARAASRGPVVCDTLSLVPLLEPLCSDGRELLLVSLTADPAELPARAVALERARAASDTAVRIAAFTSTDRAADLARLAAEQNAELLVVGTLDEGLLAVAPCDVAYVPVERAFEPGGPVLVPFGGRRDEWAALELGAWLARAHGVPLRLLGVEANGDRRDASRMLASASLALQRFTGSVVEPAIVTPGVHGILAERGAAIVASLPGGKLDQTRRVLVEQARVPVLLVHGGLRPSGLAPARTLTRFSWSLSDR